MGFGHVKAVNQDSARLGTIEPLDKRNDSRLAYTARADKGVESSRLDINAQSFQNLCVRTSRVREENVLELHARSLTILYAKIAARCLENLLF